MELPSGPNIGPGAPPRMKNLSHQENKGKRYGDRNVLTFRHPAWMRRFPLGDR